MDIATLTPEAQFTLAELEAKFPPRTLSEGARVTRFGPSPTGFMHIGGLYTSLVSRRLAHQSGGRFFLRIEDTDKKREVDGTVGLILASLATYGLSPDEGEIADGQELGDYGPYRQSERKPIYQSCVRWLLEQGHAYPCFASADELQELRDEQAKRKVQPGYYGSWAIWRDKTAADVAAALAVGLPFTVRLRATGTRDERVTLPDTIRGDLEFPANQTDVVMLKADGMPTYHLAHVVDDHFMRTTDVIRGNEWLASYPMHAQMFDLMGWAPPRFAHISPIEKQDGGSRRKLSKRHDPEASVGWYMEAGYPLGAVTEYLLNLIDGRFEEWRTANPGVSHEDFKIELEHMSRSGALFDLAKLDSVSRDVVGAMSAKAIYDAALVWASGHHPDFAVRFAADPAYSQAILDIERHGERPRKDIVRWDQLHTDIGYFFDDRYAELLGEAQDVFKALQPAAPQGLLAKVAAAYDPAKDRDQWLEWLRELGLEFGYAPNAKTFKAAPDQYIGHFGDLAGVLRVVLAARRNTPDLHEMMQVMGKDRVVARLSAATRW
ncbi:MAG: glutamate--tRNA ligase family protein [Novosphingobium sp.]|uniref:glutamate--tRNA ligase n=1 Tax=Novosphingobium sp. TaxID=1874826 RepID=UPI0032BA8DA1